MVRSQHTPTPVIAPAVLAETTEDYRRDLQLATSLSGRIQIDLVDGEFAGNRTINLAQVYWPKTVAADLHLMYNDPVAHQETLIAMAPSLVIVHAEASELADETLGDLCQNLQAVGISFGVALLPGTDVETVAGLLPMIDHLLVFTGDLGHYGGSLRYDCLDKLASAKRHNPRLELGVDGGITDETIADVVRAGAEVLNVGGFLQKASDPKVAYAKLETVIKNTL